jgi:putative endopeptidase
MTLSRKFLCVAASLTACTAPVTPTNSPAKQDFLAANMDPSVNPGQDFFTYANGGWL